ncbi:acetyltransferase [Gramella sp. MAR_2010_147]|uniref:acetyltransferase n=1 Tax=Gramella sp. MAR_2010_147 TaxID=1250205 RepID=UPI00087BA865|nr:acetyltransferase [Gramella sp. MAR_2010_147]SDR70139.1 UDP-perosamine 4-acetyltransferase [Gramella sp. MAR_2010_147]
MIIYGASGHAKVIIDIITSSNNKPIDFLLDDDRSLKKLLEFRVNHDITPEMLNQKAVIAIGDNLTRKKVSKLLKSAFCSALVHKSAVLSNYVEIGDGTVVMANAVINSSSKIGRHCIMNTAAVVEHDVSISDFVHISPAATITGNVEIGEGSHVGAGATIIPGIKIGKWVTIGAGTIVVSDVPDYAVVVGNPGRIIKYNKSENE